MSARFLDEAKAFSLIAPHLPADKRTEVAVRIAENLGVVRAPTVGTARRNPADELDIPDESPERAAAEFLAANGFTGAAQVRQTVRLAGFLRAHPGSNRAEMMRSFLARVNAESGGA